MPKKPNQKQIQKKKLTYKQEIFVKEFARTRNGTQAALASYDIGKRNKIDPRIIASAIATENLSKPLVAEAIESEILTLKSALQKQGVTPQKIARKIDNLLDNEDPNVIDKGLKHAKEIYGVEDLDTKKVVSNTYNFLFNPQAQAEIKVLEEKIKERLLNVQEIEEDNQAE